MLTPAQIEAQTFQVVRLREAGYQQDEVDKFLDEVLADYRQLLQDKEEAVARAERLGRRTSASEQTIVMPPVPSQAPGGPSLATIGLLLTQAEATAADIKAKAEADADDIRRVASDESAKFLTEVRAKAAQITAEAEQRAKVVDDNAAVRLAAYDEEARSKIDNATEKAAAIVAEGNTERYAQIGILEAQRGQLQGHVDQLTATRATVVAALAETLDKVREGS